MKVLTLKEPFASLIEKGIKKIETRSWKTNYRGELYIHAGINQESNISDELKSIVKKIQSLHKGEIILKCTLEDCIKIDNEFAEKIKREDYNNFISGDFSEGRYAWVLSNVMPIDSIKAKGKLGIWNYNKD